MWISGELLRRGSELCERVSREQSLKCNFTVIHNRSSGLGRCGDAILLPRFTGLCRASGRDHAMAYPCPERHSSNSCFWINGSYIPNCAGLPGESLDERPLNTVL